MAGEQTPMEGVEGGDRANESHTAGGLLLPGNGEHDIEYSRTTTHVD